MVYSLYFDPAVLAYLRNYPGLTRVGRISLFTNLDMLLRQLGDRLCNDPALRLSPGSACFAFQLVVNNIPGPLHVFRFVVDDSAAAMGVLQVVYAEGRPGRSNP